MIKTEKMTLSKVVVRFRTGFVKVSRPAIFGSIPHSTHSKSKSLAKVVEIWAFPHFLQSYHVNMVMLFILPRYQANPA